MKRRPPTARWRRGAGVAVVVIMMAILNIAVVGSIAASGDESHLGAMRLESARAFYAAESGGIVVVKLLKESLPLPTAGTTLTLSNSTVTFESVPAPGAGGDVVLIGRSGFAERRVRITLEAP